MKLIVPVAGVGTRLRPHTHTTPKVLIKVAGKTIIEHILDAILSYESEINEIVFIVGYLKEQIQSYIQGIYGNRIKLSYIEQKEMLGVGHAIFLTKDRVNGEPIFIILGDTIFKANFSHIINSKKNYIGVKPVEDPRRFGIVFTDNKNNITKFIEKPEKPESNLAMVGIYLIYDSSLLYSKLEYLIKNNIRTKNEFQLTDALQLMLEKGVNFKTFEIDKWLDCGKPETLLSTNRFLLEENKTNRKFNSAIIISPVYISSTAEIENSVIGPFVSIGDNVKIETSIIRNSIINDGARVNSLLISNSIIGRNTIINGNYRHLNIGDSSEVQFG